MNIFEEISSVKKNLPVFGTVEKEVGSYKFNGYQKFAIIVYILCLIFGVILGNLFPACSSTTSLYTEECLAPEFNFFLMIVFWFISLLVCVFFFGFGHIIALLTSINDKKK